MGNNDVQDDSLLNGVTQYFRLAIEEAYLFRQKVEVVEYGIIRGRRDAFHLAQLLCSPWRENQ